MDISHVFPNLETFRPWTAGSLCLFIRAVCVCVFKALDFLWRGVIDWVVVKRGALEQLCVCWVSGWIFMAVASRAQRGFCSSPGFWRCLGRMFVLVSDVCVSPDSRNLSWRSPAPPANHNEPSCFSGAIKPPSDTFLSFHRLLVDTLFLGNGMLNASFQNTVCWFPW